MNKEIRRKYTCSKRLENSSKCKEIKKNKDTEKRVLLVSELQQ